MKGYGRSFQRATKGFWKFSICNEHHLCRRCTGLLREAEAKALRPRVAEYEHHVMVLEKAVNEAVSEASSEVKLNRRDSSSSQMADVIQKLAGTCIADRDRKIKDLEKKLKCQKRQCQPGCIPNLARVRHCLHIEEPLVDITHDTPANTPGNWQYPFGTQTPQHAIITGGSKRAVLRQAIAKQNAGMIRRKMKKAEAALEAAMRDEKIDLTDVSSDEAFYTPPTTSVDRQRSKKNRCESSTVRNEILALERKNDEKNRELHSKIHHLELHSNMQREFAQRDREQRNRQDVEARIAMLQCNVNEGNGSQKYQGLGIHLPILPTTTDTKDACAKLHADKEIRRIVDDHIIDFERRHAASMGARLNEQMDSLEDGIFSEIKRGSFDHRAYASPLQPRRCARNQETHRRVRPNGGVDDTSRSRFGR